MDKASGTGERLVRVQQAALRLAEVVEDLVRDMETIALNLPDTTKRTHELALAAQARQLAIALRSAIPNSPTYGGPDRRTWLQRRVPPAEQTSHPEERRQGERRQSSGLTF
jgi:hypothetical protein